MHPQLKTLKALSNSNRLKIAITLKHGEKNVEAINRHLRITQPALSQHLAKIRKAGVVTARRDARKIYYKLNRSKLVNTILAGTK